ncbi:MAG: NADH:flavin oxidoreductase [Acidobacteria bacterium]|nr:NADH:flavin oxidoreductase [Acidobacteriota bacterium]
MPHLLSPLSFAGLRLRNRIAMPPMWSGKATPEGFVTPAIVEYHRVRAAAGTALVIVEHSFVHPQGRHSATQLGVHSDACVAGLSELAGAIRREGAVACLQISHAGSRASSTLTGLPVLAPSAIPNIREAQPGLPTPLTSAHVAEVVAAFADAARRARRAGFDAVEIHAAHGFLLSQFLSPLTNHRDDEYGGDHERRSRLAIEVLGGVKQAVGPGYPVFVRLGVHDERPGGLTLAPACWTAAHLAAGGAALIDVSGGLSGSDDPGRGPGYFVEYAEAVKSATGVPVLVAGGISDPKMADIVVRSGRSDLVGIGRAMLEDPEWARHAAEALAQA